MPGTQDGGHRYCGRRFDATELDTIRSLIEANGEATRAALARMVCEVLDWLRPDGRRKDMSCRLAMLRMHRDGLLCRWRRSDLEHRRGRRRREIDSSVGRMNNASRN